MTFYARSFQYDGIPGETFNLLISQLDDGGVSETDGSSKMEIISQKIYRRQNPYFYGATIADVLRFPATIMSPENIDAETYQLIQKWMFSNRTHKKLLMQDDMGSAYFNCIFNNPQTIRVGNLIYGFNAEVECDSAFGWQYPRTTMYTYSTSVVDSTKIFNNRSDDAGSYLYPSLVITMNNIAGGISITNANDANRVFSFTGLSASEVLTMNCGLQTLSSSTGLKRLSNFNKNFLRLVPGINSLRIQGNVASIAMTTQYVAKKIG
jgi:phage-related protein